MKLYIVRGPSGSGKSTYCAQVLIPKIREEFGVLVENRENDKFFIDSNGDYKWNPHKLWLAMKHCCDWVKRDLEKQGVAIVSNVFSTLRAMRPYFDLAKEIGADVEVLRICNLHDSIHCVPEETIERVKSDMQDCPGEKFVH